MSENQSQSQDTFQWERAMEFTRDINRGKFSEKLAAVVCRSTHYPFPRYSVKVGALRQREGETELFPFVNPYVTGQQADATIVDDSLLIVAGLLQEAHEWIQGDACEEASRVKGARAAMQEARKAKAPAAVAYKPTAVTKARGGKVAKNKLVHEDKAESAQAE